MSESKITLNLIPKPLPRARHSSRGGFVRSYYPKNVQEIFDAYDAEILNQVVNEPMVKKYIGEDFKENVKLEMNVTFFMPIPKSTSKKKKEELILQPHIKTPDLDNLLKMLFDRLDGKLFENDKLIYSINSKKVYDTEPRIEFVVKEG